jgi:hypothetical protein
MRVGPSEKAAEPTHRRFLCQRAARVVDLPSRLASGEEEPCRHTGVHALSQSGFARAVGGRLTPFLPMTYKPGPDVSFITVRFVQGYGVDAGTPSI